MELTKEHFDQQIKKLVTKEDLDKRLANFVTKNELQNELKEFVTKDVLRIQLKMLREDIKQDIKDALTGLASRMRIVIDEPIILRERPRPVAAKQSPHRPDKSSRRKAPSSGR